MAKLRNKHTSINLGTEILLLISRVKIRNIFGHKNPADGTFGYFFQLCYGQSFPDILWGIIVWTISDLDHFIVQNKINNLHVKFEKISSTG